MLARNMSVWGEPSHFVTVAPLWRAALSSTLQSNVTYYSSVRVVGLNGLMSLNYTSCGVTLDVAPPVFVPFPDGSLIWNGLGGSNAPYSNASSSLSIQFRAIDPDSGVYTVEYALGTGPSSQNVLPFTVMTSRCECRCGSADLPHSALTEPH